MRRPLHVHRRVPSGLALVLGSLAIAVASAEETATSADDLPASHSVAPQLYATGFAFAEGPTFDRQGNLYVVNYRVIGTIGRITRDGTANILCHLAELAPMENREPRANGLKVDSEGRLIVADSGGGRLLRISLDGEKCEILADRYQGERFRSLNDAALDLAGNIYFTDPGGSSLSNPVGAVYRYNVDTKKVERIDAGLAFPNGLGVTPDQSKLCVCESQRYRLLVYPMSEEGDVGERSVLMEFPKEDDGEIRGGAFEPDGVIFDEAGRLYVAMWTGGVVNVVCPETGKLLRQYDAGGSRATNVHFFGESLYTTVAAKEAVFRLPLGVRGFAYNGPD